MAGCDPGLLPPFLYVDVNDFDDETGVAHVCFAIPDPSPAKVRVYNGAGERIARLYDGFASGGVVYARIWDGTNEAGKRSATGVYVVRLDTPDWHLVKKVAVVR